MINLEPIPKKIQQRMFQKMKALRGHNTSGPNTSNNSNELTFDNMATRTTYIKMVSNQFDPVTLMAGKLKSDGNMYAGYDAYSPRSYGAEEYVGSLVQNTELFTSQPELQGQSMKKRASAFYKEPANSTTVNQNSRPIPGIKSIDVTFKGGLKSLREATINWVCWDFGELDELMPHFLATGKTVLLEWGWVYGKKNPASIQKLIGANGKILSNAFEDYKDIIIGGQGDFDIMVGVVKNFEFTNRADGGFDCQTVLISTGVSTLDNAMPNITTVDKTVDLDLNPKESERETQKKLSKATKFFKTAAGEINDSGEVPEIITLNTNVTLKLFVDKIDDYIKKEIIANGIIQNGGGRNAISYVANKFLMHSFMATGAGNVTNIEKQIILDTWVSWGWFEDNVLNKFLGMTNGNGDDITTFKSVEKVLAQGGFSSGTEQSVRIRNHQDLETIDINNHILPGQFYVATELKDESGIVKLKGDSKYIQTLAKIVNENFTPFASTGVINRVDDIDTMDASTREQQRALYENEVNMVREQDRTDTGAPKRKATTPSEQPKPGKFGFLRNMLIHTKVIKQAFGSEGAFTAETINITEALESMFYLINQDLNFWSLQTSVDSENTSRVKIVDDSTTAIEFDKINIDLGMSSLETKTDDNSIIIGKEGIFYFPVWRPDSFVKSQNMTLKISNAQQMTAMYGANMNVTRNIQNPGSTQVDKGATLAGGFFNDSEDASKQGIDIRFRNEINNGSTDTEEKKDSINEFIKTNVNELEKAYEDKLKTLNAEILARAKTEIDDESGYDPAVAPPLPRNFTNDEKLAIIEKAENSEGGAFRSKYGYGSELIVDLLNKKFDKTGRIKSAYLGSISNLITNHGSSNQSDTPVLIPFDLDLDIDGTGGIYPGNSFHSTYVPSRYQKLAVFQAFDISHKVDSGGWTTTIGGKMRSTANLILNPKPRDEKIAEQIDNLDKQLKKASTEAVKVKAKQIETQKRLESENKTNISQGKIASRNNE